VSGGSGGGGSVSFSTEGRNAVAPIPALKAYFNYALYPRVFLKAAAKGISGTVDGVASGDILLQVGDVPATGATMGTVVDALRGKPGDVRILKLERKGKPFTVEARVERVI